ncbi:hypothetical protein GNP84_18890 [Aliivibrio fischeri]|uniref:hypothetical protein n=1 Tax=Aliivibrio fischeri TaxID=668 RepID=UPI0012D97A6B|nr:hypothetical protein [Aliivibrio fischeri]MUK78950.1 hypothetical protein [Aliivibrio fischeri]
MPTISGYDIISDMTEKSGRRLLVVAFMTILIKLYEINLGELNLFGVKIPANLFDLVAVILILYFFYALLVNWLGDLASFKLWYSSNNIHSNFGTNMTLDKEFLDGGSKLLLKLYELEKSNSFPTNYADVDEAIKKEYRDYKLNVELYCVRLEGAGQRFNQLSKFGHFYVWFQSFLLPVTLGIIAIIMLFLKGSFQLPPVFGI